ncbi:MAG TPA: o-succinylbenzoate synthase [Bacteroidales bacterium]|jgi:o-succinylbenzoate synthase|nr:o-succinylbenzoate synthase [Bacteroidales bacterium]
MIKARSELIEFKFQRPATTSRGTHTSKKVQFIVLYHSDDPSIAGVGECSLFPGLSHDDVKGFKTKLAQTIERINQGDYYTDNSLTEWPSINFAIETAWKDLRANGSKVLYPSGFTEGKDSIWINGLIWMADKNDMIRQIRQRLNDGFTCLKLKIGALDLREEIEVLKFIREHCSAEELEIRVDANGAFTRSEALEVLKILSEYHLHSVEQPIAAGHPEEMAKLCSSSPVPVAIDEELIGKHNMAVRRKLLETIKPKYIVIKPGLLGGIAASKDWITLAKEKYIGWWITSSLETNIGLNAIAQWTYTLENHIYHGLSTGSLYNNNIRSPLYLHGERLYYDPERKWDLSPLEIE